MKDLTERQADRAVVGVRGHDFFHVRPPAFALWCFRDGSRARFVFDLHLREKLLRFRVQEYRVAMHTVAFDDGFEFGPNRAMASLVFLLKSGSN